MNANEFVNNYEVFNIDNSIMTNIKMELNRALLRAVSTIKDFEIATVTKSFLPFEFQCNVTTKRDVSKEKGKTDEVRIIYLQDGIAAMRADGQVSLFDYIHEDEEAEGDDESKDIEIV